MTQRVFELNGLKSIYIMRKLSLLIIVSVLISCQSEHNKDKNNLKRSEIDSAEFETIDVETLVQLEDDLGMWQIGYYSDEFGDKTDNKFIYSEPIFGTFRNSATIESDLMVCIVIDSKTSISIGLFEYLDHVVTGNYDDYEIKIKYGNNEIVEFKDYYSKRTLRLKEKNSEILYNILLKEEPIKFFLKNVSEHFPSTYNFTIENPKGIENAIKKLENI